MKAGFTFGFLLMVAFSASASVPVTELTLKYCHELFEASPFSQEAAHCFYELGRYQNREDDARRELGSLQQKNPENPEVLLNLAYLEQNVQSKENYYQAALEIFRTRQDVNGELRTRDSYGRFLQRQGRLRDAELQLRLMDELRDETAHWSDVLRIDLAWARYIYSNRKEFVRAKDLIKAHEDRLVDLENYRLESWSWELLGDANLELGMPSKAYRYYLKASGLAAQKGAFGEESYFLGNALMALRDEIEEATDDATRQDAIQFTREVLEKANRTNVGHTITRALLLLGDLHRGEEARSFYQECVDLTAGRPGFIEEHRVCKFSLAANIASKKPDRAMALLREIRNDTADIDDLLSQVYDRHSELRVLWKAADFEDAWKASQETLDLVEELRDVQPEAQGRARSIAAWGMSYPWLGGLVLLHFEETGSEGDLQKALTVIERMRARLLLEELIARARPQSDSAALEEVRDQLSRLLVEKSRIQWHLRFAKLTGRARQRAGKRLDELHEDIARIRRRLSQLSGRFEDLRLPDFATITDIQEHLRDHEALLSFQLAPWESAVEAFAGGSWLIVITRNHADAYRVPDSDKITDRVDMFTGLLDQGKVGLGLANRLYEDLLAEALEDLPPEITDLIVIPDKALHRLPFAALRPSKDAPPLATRYRFSRVPSATLWLRRWREPGPPSVAPQPALVLADPGTFESADAGGSQIASLMRDGDLFRAESYGPLPFARQEGWSLLRQLGPSTEVLTGFEASERFLKTAENLDRFGILHFAAHAVANEEEPDRAGIFLAPDLPGNGAPAELDGVLQFNEIVDLGFNDRTVVLSTCHSARGQILRGEGVFDLARAFFEGGARAVVGSLWRLEDQATALFFDDFYRHLARGISLSEALHRAQKDQIDRGAPPSVWAGIVVIGDGSLVPVPSRGGRHHPAWPIGLAAVLLLVAVAVAARRSP